MKALYLGFTFFSAAIILTGCYKPGCTDYDATNYDIDAKTDDLSCTYNGSVFFWCPKPVSDSLIAMGHTMLRFELEGVIVDSIATASFFTPDGGCNASGTKTIQRDFAGNTERKYKYRVRGAGFTTLYEGYIDIKANDCVGVEFDYPQ